MPVHHGLELLLYRYTLPSMFGLLCLENLGMPFVPIELGYIATHALISRGRISYAVALAVCVGAQFLGSLISYLVGRRFGKRLLVSEDFHAAEQRVAGWYHRHGPAAVVTARFVGQVRPWSSYIAGIAQMEPAPFVVFTLIGSIAFNLAGLALATTIARFWDEYPLSHLVALLLGLGGIAWFVISISGIGRNRDKRNLADVY